MPEYDSRSRLYAIWKGIIRRCENENTHNFGIYGGKGVIVCKEWRKFPAFREWAVANGYEDNLTIERVNINGNYEPSNCIWADRVVQNNNTSRNHFIEWNGGIYTIAELSRISGIKQNTLLYRIRRGWSADDAMSVPVEKKQR